MLASKLEAGGSVIPVEQSNTKPVHQGGVHLNDSDQISDISQRTTHSLARSRPESAGQRRRSRSSNLQHADPTSIRQND